MTYRTRRFFWTVFWLVALYAVVGFFVLPPMVRAQLERRASEQLGRRVEIGRVRLNPFSLSATLEQVDVRTAGGGASFAGWDRLYVNFEALSSISGDWVIGEVELVNFHASVALDEKGVPNFADIVARFAPEHRPLAVPQGPSRPWRIQRLRVADSHLEFSDRSHGPEFHTTAGPIDFSLVEFRTVGAVGAPYRFEASTDAGERIAWNGTLSMAPLTSKGELTLENLSLSKYAPYLADRMRGSVTAGRLTVNGKYEIHLAPENREIALTDAIVQLRGLKLIAPGEPAPAIELPSVDANGIALDALAARLSVEQVRVDGGHLALHRDAQGRLNLQQLVSDGAEKSAAGPSSPPDVAVNEISWHDLKVDWSDASAPSPVDLHLTSVTGSLTQATLAPGASIPLDLSFGWLPQGTAHLAGSVMLSPVHADLQVDLGALALPPLGPYLENELHARVAEGTLTLKGRATFALSDAGPPAAAYHGSAQLAGLHLTGGPAKSDFAGLEELALDGIEVATAPRLTIRTTLVNIRSPYVHAILPRDGPLNLATVFASTTAPTADDEPPAVHLATAALAAQGDAPGDARPALAFPLVTISGGNLTYTDRSVQPEVKVSIGELTGKLSNLSSEHPETGDVDLRAVIDGKSPLVINGHFNPFAPAPRADLKVNLQPVPLQPAAPYVRKYAGYHLESGQLALRSQAGLAGQKLDLANHITLEQFTLGEPAPGPNATKLPVKLGIALLKDTKGRIELDVPVEGSLSDPNFQIDHVVSHVLTNTLKKAATSPFALLGAMFGGGGEELGQQDFPPGEAVPSPESGRRLQTVARALANRPALRVEIEAGYDANADTPVLQQKKLDDAVRSTVWEERHAHDPSTPPATQLDISDEDYAAAVRTLFAEAFPAAGASAAPSASHGPEPPPPAPAEVEEDQPEPPPHRSLWRKTLDVVTLKHLRERHAEHRAEKRARKAAEARQEAEAERESAATAQAQPPAPSLPIDEMTARLAPTFDVTPAELQALAQARAETVQEKLVAGGKIAAERVTVKKNDDPAAAAKLGDHARLQLQ